MTPWSRLQALSIEHANRIGPGYASHMIRSLGRHYQRQHIPPQTIVDNCDILKRHDDEEMKARVLWYVAVHPDVFQACSEVWNAA